MRHRIAASLTIAAASAGLMLGAATLAQAAPQEQHTTHITVEPRQLGDVPILDSLLGGLPDVGGLLDSLSGGLPI